MTIVSFSHRFVFIKTQKTAGTSIEVDLSQRVGADDVVTPVLPPETGHYPRNHIAPDRSKLFWNHMAASDVRTVIGRPRFDSYFKFCVEREPVDKCLSHFHMLKNRIGPIGLPEPERAALTWPDYVERGKFPVDTPKYTDPSDPTRLLVNRVLAYERLHDELPTLLDHLGIPGFRVTARAKAGYRLNEHVRREDVTPRQRRVIYEAFARSVELTGLYVDPV